MNQRKEIIALKRIDSIVNAFYSGRLVITSESNGYSNNAIGLDVVMAMIKNHIIDGLQETLERKEGYLYVESN